MTYEERVLEAQGLYTHIGGFYRPSLFKEAVSIARQLARLKELETNVKTDRIEIHTVYGQEGLNRGRR